MKAAITRLSKHKLVHNSIFLMASAGLNSVVGYVFFIIVARLYAPEQVGYASNLFAALSIIMTLSFFGLDESMIKFYSSSDKKKLVGTAVLVVLSGALFFSLIFAVILSGIDTYAALFLQPAGLLLYVASCMAWVLFQGISNIYIAQRKAHFVLIKETVFNVLRLAFPFILISAGFIGIFLSWTIPALVALVVIYLFTRVEWELTVDRTILRRIFHFSVNNYITKVAFWLRGFALPLLVTFVFGPAATAFFYMPYKMFETFYYIINAVGKSLFAEVSFSASNSSKKFFHALALSLALSLAFALFIFLFGDLILQLFGLEYAQQGGRLLRILSLAAIPVTVNEIMYTRAKHESHMRDIFVSRGLPSILTLVFVVFMYGAGIEAITYAVLGAETLVALYLIVRVIL